MNPFYKIYTKLTAKMVGTDAFGNRYFLLRQLNSEGQNKRMVIYRGMPEPSKIPPVWKLWLHYTTNEIPGRSLKDYQKYSWQKPHLPNLTGTIFAYKPKLHIAKKLYNSWNPNQQ